MTISEWLAPHKRTHCDYKFAVIDVTEACDVSDEIRHYLARQLVLAHGNPGMIKAECQKLLDDARELELENIEHCLQKAVLADWDQTQKRILENYLEHEILPSTEKVITRIGNFGEVIAALFLIEFEGFWFPIYKLRYREKKDWASRLTDLCLIKIVNDQNPLICYGEVKTHSSKCDKKLGIQGHDSLSKDDALNNPEILRFISTRLYESGRFDEASFISDLRLGRTRYNRRHDLYLIHDSATWSEEILERLHAHDLDKSLADFSVRVLLIRELRGLIDRTYECSWIAAKDIVDEQE